MATLISRPLPTILQYGSSNPHSQPTSESYISHTSGHDESSNQHYDSSDQLSKSKIDLSVPAQLPKGARPPTSPFSKQILGRHISETVVSPPTVQIHTQTASIWRIQLPTLSKVVKWVRPKRQAKKLEFSSSSSPSEDPLSSDQASGTRESSAPELDKPLPPIIKNDDPLPQPNSIVNDFDGPGPSARHPLFLQSVYRSESYMSSAHVSSAHGSYDLSSSSSRLELIQDSSGSQIEIVTSSSGRVRARQQPPRSRQASTVYSNLDYRLYEEVDASSPAEDAYTDIGHTSIMRDSVSDMNHGIYSPRPRPYSDIGHGQSVSDSYYPVSADNTISTRRRRTSFFERSSGRKLFNASAPLLLPAQSSGENPAPTTPRKLRKSHRSSSEVSNIASSSTPPSSFKFPLRISRIPNFRTSSDDQLTVTPSRKLTKKKPAKRMPAISAPPTSTRFETTPFVFEPDTPRIKFPSKQLTDPYILHSDPTSPPRRADFIDDQNSEQSANINARPQRRSFLRTESNRRWTMAMAEAPEELFVAELDRLRRMGMRAKEVHGIIPFPKDDGLPLSVEETSFREESTITSFGPESNNSESWPTVVDHTEDEEEWMNARRALLCCRELVRTERSYEESLQLLALSETSQPVPALLQQYIPALLSASKTLSSYFNEDPSALGVSAAFIGAEDQLEAALVAWCGVVGEFFVDATSVTDEVVRMSASSTSISQRADADVVPSRVNSGLKLESPQANDITQIITPDRAQSIWKRPVSITGYLPSDARSRKKSTGSKSVKEKEKEKKRKPHLRDLAIQPTQRITRYVLLYKDLLKYTPLASPAYTLVKSAVESSIRIAQKCDKAQGNAAFLLH